MYSRACVRTSRASATVLQVCGKLLCQALVAQGTVLALQVRLLFGGRGRHTGEGNAPRLGKGGQLKRRECAPSVRYAPPVDVP